MNRNDLLAQAKYHTDMAKFHQKTVDHHLSQAEGFMKRAQAVKKIADTAISKTITGKILGKLKLEQTSRE